MVPPLAACASTILCSSEMCKGTARAGRSRLIERASAGPAGISPLRGRAVRATVVRQSEQNFSCASAYRSNLWTSILLAVQFTDPRFLFVFLPAVFACYFLLRALERQRTRLGRWASGSSMSLLLGVSAAFVALLIAGDGQPTARRTLVPLGLAVIGCHVIAYAADVRRGQADGKRPFVAALYAIQFPLLAAGPIVRYR